MELLIIYGLGIFFAILIGARKARPILGIFMGVAFSWLGVLIMMIIPRKTVIIYRSEGLK